MSNNPPVYRSNANKSSIYGNYGGVAPQNYYRPPNSSTFTPQPARLVFSETERHMIQQLLDQTSFYKENAPNILMRTLVASTSGNVETFTLSTSAKPEDVVTYTASTDIVDLNRMDGGFF
jgi:hypothetical protein